MIITYHRKIDEYLADGLPTGAVISFGVINWERVGAFWLRSQNDNPETIEDIEPAMDTTKMVDMISSLLENNPDIYPQFSVLVPEEAEAFSTVSWHEEDIESVFMEHGVECTIDQYNEVEARLTKNIDEAMIATGWELIRAEVDKVLNKKRRKRK